MATFTFDRPDFGGMLDELNNGFIVTLTKANGASILLQHSNDFDENGDEIINFTLTGTAVANIPMSAGDLFDFLEGLEFTNYEAFEA